MRINYDILPKPFFILAPMDDVTDTVFRQVIGQTSPPDMYFTEFVNVDGLQSPGRIKLLKKLRFTESVQPLIAQFWGKVPENFYKTAQQIADGTFAKELGLPKSINFAGVDLNMGCPQKTEVNHGTCCALMNDRPLTSEIIKATKQGLYGRIPLSIKTRVGFNDVDMTWIRFLLEHDLQMLTVHGRTRKQMSKVPADWDLIGQARDIRDNLNIKTLIVGNGDVLSRAQGMDLAEKYELDGIMIGRGIFHDPFAFNLKSPWLTYTPKMKVDLFKKHLDLFTKTWTNNERPLHTINKFCKIYINGFNGAKEAREELMLAKNIDELQELLYNVKLSSQSDNLMRISS